MVYVIASLFNTYFCLRTSLRLHAPLQRPQDKRRGAGHHQPHLRLSGHRPAGQVLDSACQVQPEDAYPHLRHERQLCLHAGRGLLPGDSEGKGGGHGGCGRLLHGCLHRLYPQRDAGAGGA